MDGIWIWIIIAGVLVLAFGPILYLLPSRKDRRLAALRAEARRLGLTVELKPVRNLDAAARERVTAGGRQRTPVHASARYSLTLDRMPDAVPAWRLLRSARGWTADDGLAAPAGLLSRLKPLVETLPDDVVAIDFGGRSAGCYWLESFPSAGDAVEGIKGFLFAVGAQVAAFSAETDNG